MRKFLCIIVLLKTLNIQSQDTIKPIERKWRVLTVSNLSGITASGHYLQTLSLSLDYELKNKWSLSSWSGINYNKSYNGGWVSSSFILSKNISNFNIGTGILYGSGNLNTPLPDNIVSKDISWIINVNRRFRLK